MTLTVNTQTLANYSKAADTILALIDDLGFTTDKAFDVAEFKRKIVWAIVSNTTNGEVWKEVGEQEPTDEDLEQLLKDLKQENEREQSLEQLLKYLKQENEREQSNICPECGNPFNK